MNRSEASAGALRAIGFRLAAVALALSLFGVVLEIGLRQVSRLDPDGNVYVGKYRLRPFRAPVAHIRDRLALRRAIERPYIRYDPDLGWSVAASSTSTGGMYTSNARGIRCADREQETPQRPAAGTLRIALYGDSFTHGDDVVFAESWGAILAAELAHRGKRVEVLNQGTPGYGIDQAFLRWQKEGRPLTPHVVVFGFQSTDARRNLNLFRNLYTPDSNLTFAKPRFLLDGDSMRLINTPTPHPDDLPAILDDFEHWPLHQHEFFYRRENYADSPLYASRAMAFLSSGFGTRFSQRRKGYDFFAPGGESYQLAWNIVVQFEREVRASGARFVILHIPTRKPLRRRRAGRDLPHQALLDAMKARFEVVDPTAALLRRADANSLEALFAPGSGHFSGLANEALGAALAAYLSERDANRERGVPGHVEVRDPPGRPGDL